MQNVGEILACLSRRRFPLNEESRTQAEIAKAFDECGIEHQREVRLDAKSRIDFMIGCIGLEVKIKGEKMAIYRQCERYCEFDAISALILVTNVPTGFPREINGKPVYVVNLAKAWL